MRHGLAAQRGPTHHAPLIPQRTRQSAEQCRAQRAVAWIQRRQRALEEGHEPLVITCAQPVEHPAVAERRVPERFVEAEMFCDLGSLPEGSLRTILVPAARGRFSKTHEERVPVKVVETAGLQPEPVEPCGLLVRVHRCRPLGSASGVIDGDSGFRSGPGKDEVVRQLRQRRIRRAAR